MRTPSWKMGGGSMALELDAGRGRRVGSRMRLAGRAFGMRSSQVVTRILFPQMVRHAIPGFGNNWLVLLKTTALLSVIGLDDMVRKASLAAGATREPFTFYIAVALIYLALTTVSVLALGWLERRSNLAYRRA